MRRHAVQGVAVNAADSDQRPILRAGLAAVVVADLIFFHFAVREARSAALERGLAISGLVEALSHPLIVSAVVLAGVVAIVVFASAPARRRSGLVSLMALVFLSTVHAQLFGSPWRHLFYSGLCLAGWLVGLSVSRRNGELTDESYARVGSIALLGAAYFNAGVSKIAFGGLDWISGLPVQAAIVAQDGLVADSVVSAYRYWVVTTPAVAALFSILTVGFELAGPLMLIGRRVGVFVVLGLVAMHLNLYVLTPILYWEPMVLLPLFGLSPDTRDLPYARSSMAPAFLQGRAFVFAAVLLGVGAMIAIGHQAARFADARRVRPPESAAREVPPEVPPVAPAPPTGNQPAAPSALRNVGPFTVGQNVADSWSIDALIVTDEAVILELAGQPGRSRFELTCRSQFRSPFDLGKAHILYSQHTEFSALEAAGWALRRQLEAAVQGSDVCDRLAEWREAAR